MEKKSTEELFEQVKGFNVTGPNGEVICPVTEMLQELTRILDKNLPDMTVSSKKGKLALISAGVLSVSAVAAALYFAYKKGRVDEINEICWLVKNGDDLNLGFFTKHIPKGKTMKLLIRRVFD